MKREYNLRERAEIVVLAQRCSTELKAQPLIDYFESKLKDCDICKYAKYYRQSILLRK